MFPRLAIFAALALTFATLAANATPVLAPLFRDGAVLQREKTVPVWGLADPGEKITINFASQTASATADASGRWLVLLPAMPASAEPTEMTVTGNAAVTVRDILVGEVWLSSGQSNMQMTVDEAANPQEEIAAADYPLIRYFDTTRTTAAAPASDVAGNWSVCSPATAGKFSAAAYYFGRELHRKLGVPVGLVNSSWGATTIEPWISLEAHMHNHAWSAVRARAADGMKTLEREKNGYDETLAAWEKNKQRAAKNGDAFTQPKPRDPQDLYNRRHPAGIFNGMIAPLIPYALRGILWYQGESNTDRPQEYRTLFPTLIRQWRADFAQGDLPFYYVQLAGHAFKGDANGTQLAAIRNAQQSALALSNVAQALATDIGDIEDVHPKNKQELGRRLALIALARDYGRAGEYIGPTFCNMSFTGSATRIRFDHADGLHLKNLAASAPVTGFELAGKDGKFHPAFARIEGAEVVLTAPQVAAPAAVRYAWRNFPAMSLYNGANLPAPPFCTDNH